MEFETDENTAQKIYGEFMASSTTSIEADHATIAEKEKHVAESSSELSKSEESQFASGEMLESLDGTLMSLHAECS